MRLFTAAQMREADRLTIAAGTSGRELMERAGAAVAEAVRRMGGGPVAVMCGPGNNGGDGFVAARLLAGHGTAVTVHLLGERQRLTGDAALAAADWTGPVHGASGGVRDCALIVDALFGTGLTRALDGEAAAVVEAINRSGLPVLAVDMPSGVDSDTGEVCGVAVRAARTVTFAGAKAGHFLLPGRTLRGQLHVVDIGIPGSVVAGLDSRLAVNGPETWQHALPSLEEDSHKYRRGHALVLSGPMTRTGAARLAARAALRVGSGLVTLGSPRSAVLVNAAHLTAIMLRPCDGAAELREILEDPRFSVVALGPGYGVGEATREAIRVAGASGRGLVLDADALTSFEGDLAGLASALGGAPAVLTPHGGEFERLTRGADGTRGVSKVERARAAAAHSGAVLVLKGADTVIAASDGRAAINAHASPYLATAGSGDVLTGLVAGLMAQGMPPYEAACAGVWLHGDAGLRLGPGLIAEDLPEIMPAALRGLADKP
ncbi:NAD(P)H-hydrate dehydratase [Salinarimonas soli]|uniref:Bifunctional NAD(P)H-hydrate repair enzyme n=1 Tax=Salinarimonas soli TaxID=1638099 RepID=A0A5B2VZL0_9HYPH|nr:NAD(P)H-hydrate dehydratase [Salinarimonas soli]KAA2244118.1 NAD(P)H-hydrate dehydratase [Salinarimonas soli]